LWKLGIGEGITLTRSRFLVALLLFVNAMAWSYMNATEIGMLLRTIDMRLVGYAAYYFSTAIFALVGGFLANWVRRRLILYAWTVFGAAASCLPIFLRDLSPAYLLLICLIWGASVGVGMPSCLSLLSSLTNIEDRGRISGVILFVTCVAIFPAVFLIYNVDAVAGSVLLVVWRLAGLIPLRHGDWSDSTRVEKRLIPYSSVLRDRSFLLYFLPWLTFTFVDTTEQTVLLRFFGSDLCDLISIMGLVLGAVTAVLGGIMLDLIGRKRTVIFGFVVLGLGYAILGLAASASASWIAFMIADGAAWGILTTMFMLVLWADLSPKGCEAEYYAIGFLPPSLASAAKVILVPALGSIQISGAFSLASLFLFLSVVPLLIAPETLPEKVIEQRRIRSYIDRAKRLAKGHVSNR